MRPHFICLVAFAAVLLTSSANSQEEKKEPLREKPRTEDLKKPELERKEEPRHHGAEARRVSTEPSAQKRTWVGVATVPIDFALREHLELPDGFGLHVVEVVPGSPASKSGLRNNDIITRFEDQRLISPEHLSLLVRTKASGEKVSLTIIRKGQEEAIELTMGETDEE